MANPEPESLNARRDAFVKAARALMRRVADVELDEVKGILNRTASVLATQGPNLDRLAALDLESPPADPEAAVSTLLSAQHLPQMVICFSRVLLQEQHDASYLPFEEQAAALGSDLALLINEWVLRHRGLAPPEGDDEEAGWV